MSDVYWTITPTATCDGPAYQARALGRVSTHPGLVDTRALGAMHLIGAGEDRAQKLAEADGWVSGLPCDPDYAPLTPPPPPAPRVVVPAVPEPVLVPAPLPPPISEPEPLPKPPARPARKLLKRAPARKPRG